MMTPNLKFNMKLFNEVVAKEKNVTTLSKNSGINIASLYDAKNGRGISERTAQRLSDYTGISVDEWTRDVPIVTVSLEYQYESERVIMGLIENVRSRLRLTLTTPTIDEINQVINSIIVESTYLGVMAQKNGHSAFVENAMKRRLAR